ncbi:uncharacterized protein PIG-H [Drosophila tropicalis]|uniref:uncharacterized protein PIG-H n=1 Tax=Drosophila tropicalis TaxID=46794 RepID=UPI0035AC1A6D
MEPHIKIVNHKYYSRHAKYAGLTEADLELCIRSYDNDAVVRIELLNRQFGSQWREQLHRFWVLVGLITVYFACVWTCSSSVWQVPTLIFAMLMITLGGYILSSALNLVQSEKLFYSWDLALQTETVHTFGRKTIQCVQRGHLYDIVLNEVIENLDVKYMLIVRTKGGMFDRKPIIPLFNMHSPSFECLQHIYRIIHGHWLQNENSSLGETNQDFSISKPSSAAL